MAVVARLFHAALGGRPDAEGFGYWKAGIEDPGDGLTVRDVAGAFVASAEFQAAYSGPSNRDYAPAPHRGTLLRRDADQAGLEHWTAIPDAERERADALPAFPELPSTRTSLRR